MLPANTSLATLDLTGLHQLADTAQMTVECVSVHNTSLLEQLIEKLPTCVDVWLIATNLQLLPQPILALDRLAKVAILSLCHCTIILCTQAMSTSGRVFVAIPAELCSNLSPQLSSQVVRMAYHGVDVPTVISSQLPLIRKLYGEYPSDHVPINWLVT